ncbi:antitoxin family protein [Pyrococcus horikoshii]|uniref:Antitoxin n=1 Tax=Pyrococcus horikoshii TaxID=53953 RepID=A0A832SX33_PYRHR|nr:antitoxin family protein [Pyrococcus horikoshii]HII61020.1 antitoxin family protein [Pyrococcus horikoshii]
MSIIINKNGVFKPLKKVKLKDCQKVKIRDVSKYYGVFGKASAKELEELGEDAQM